MGTDLEVFPLDRAIVRRPLQTPFGALAEEGCLEAGRHGVRSVDLLAASGVLIVTASTVGEDGRVLRILVPPSEWTHAAQWVDSLEPVHQVEDVAPELPAGDQDEEPTRGEAPVETTGSATRKRKRKG